MTGAEAIQEIAKQGKKHLTCEVLGVEGRFCDCLPIEENGIIYDVMLQTEEKSGVLMVPAIGSKVVVTLQSKTRAFVSAYGELQSIKFLDGTFGGVVKVQELVEKLNTLEQDINSLKNAFNTWVVVANDGGAALKSAAGSWAGDNLTETTVADIENNRIRHGK
jgi:uncharacterized protein YoxC